jgi:hypothetical protein
MGEDVPASWVMLDEKDRRGARLTLRLLAQRMRYNPAEVRPNLSPINRKKKAGGLPGVPRSTVERFKVCGLVTAGGSYAGLTLNAAGTAGTSGLITCARAMVCPCCGVRVREARRDHLHELLSAHLAPRRPGVAPHEARSGFVGPRQPWGPPVGGGRAFFVTLTMRHDATMPLAETLGVISDAWRQISSSPVYQRWNKDAGLGMVSAVEVTQGKHGWHPHLHLVLFQGIGSVRRAAGQWVRDNVAAPEVWTDEKAEEFQQWMRTKWVQVLTTHYEKAGITLSDSDRADLSAHSLDWRECHASSDAVGLSRYLTKDTTEAARLRMLGLSAEVTRGDNKTGRLSKRHETRPAFDLVVDWHCSEGKARRLAARRWREYEEAMRGFRWWRVSHGLAVAVGVVADDRTDDEIAAESVGVTVVMVAGRDWYRMAKKGVVPQWLRRLEEVGPVALYLELLNAGVEALLCVDWVTGEPVAHRARLDLATGEWLVT